MIFPAYVQLRGLFLPVLFCNYFVPTSVNLSLFSSWTALHVLVSNIQYNKWNSSYSKKEKTAIVAFSDFIPKRFSYELIFVVYYLILWTGRVLALQGDADQPSVRYVARYIIDPVIKSNLLVPSGKHLITATYDGPKIIAPESTTTTLSNAKISGGPQLLLPVQMNWLPRTKPYVLPSQVPLCFADFVSCKKYSTINRIDLRLAMELMWIGITTESAMVMIIIMVRARMKPCRMILQMACVLSVEFRLH